jgi:hypothetical protein
VTRYRRAHGLERQQLRWVTLAATLTGVAMLATGVLVAVGNLALAGCATRSTWTPCTPSCWPWSTRRSSPPGPRCGCDHRPGQAWPEPGSVAVVVAAA